MIAFFQFIIPRQVSSPGRNAMTSSNHLSGFRRLPAWALAILFVLGTGAIPAHAETRTTNLWWAPQAVTKQGHQIDALLMFIFWLTLGVFIVTQVVYAYFIVKYRYRKGVKAVYSHGNNSLELVWTAIPAVIFVMLAIFSNRLWLELRRDVPKDAMKIDIVAYQFGFHIRNPGLDKELGPYDLEHLVKGENNFGQDLTKETSFDDYQSENQLTLPVNRAVNVILRSQDVIHAFYIPEFRVYQDMVPGRTISWMWFVPEKVGHYALACNQLCGTGHYNMQAKIDVVSEADYDKLVAEKSAAALKTHNDKVNEAKTAQQPAVSSSEVVAANLAH